MTGSPSAPRPNDSAGADPEGAPRRGALHALGLDRPELRAWALYDWANSAFVTTVVTAVFPVYFASVCASSLAPSAATARFAMASTVALVITAAIAPLLGALADRVPIKKKLLGAFAAFVLGVVAYILWADDLGFLLLAPPILFAWLFALRVRPALAVTVAVVASLVIWFAFYKLLRVPLPWGVLKSYAF